MNKTKSFIIRTVAKIVMIAVLVIIASRIIDTPIITNEIALSQMNNDSMSYVGLNLYNGAKPYVSLILYVIAIISSGKVVFNIYKFIKNKKESV